MHDCLYCMLNELISLHSRTERTRFAHEQPIYSVSISKMKAKANLVDVR